MSPEIKKEIEIGVDISKLLLRYQQGEFDFDTFAEKSLVEVRKSYFTDIDRYACFLEAQRDIKLPNGSSGSTLKAILDLDGLFELVAEDDDEENLDLLYDNMWSYQQKLLTNA